MILTDHNIYQLHTAHTSYVFSLTPTGHLQHLYYGRSLGEISADDAAAMEENSARHLLSYDHSHLNVNLENVCLEISSYGKGDIREPFIELIHADGNRTCDFLFEKAMLLPDKVPYETLPGSYGLPADEHLCIVLKESSCALFLELHYYVYADCDVICRSTRLSNVSGAPVHIQRLLSTQLDLPDCGYVMTTFTGAWAREMRRTDTPVASGMHSISSVAGSTSHRANSFFMLSKPGTSENAGDCFGFHLFYSGNHYEAVQASPFGKTRVVTGICPTGFSWLLSPGENFEAPEAAMSFSSDGYTGLSKQLHRFIRTHVVRGYWKDSPRPVLLNSWEACYFDFNEERLLHLARTAAQTGIELFVLDDGWFGQRDNDMTSLGDWQVNTKKIPDGLSGLSEKIRKLGMNFGIWVEPEMVNVNSALYRTHPDWVLQIPGRPHSEGRNQRILDLANPAVVDYLTGVLTALFSSADISYVKWDMNRIFSDVYSPYLPAGRQGETAHRYLCGLYRLLGRLTQTFPQILFEGCAAGGGRFDPGMLCYFPQIWGSDNTDPVCRARIQEGYSFGYPLSCIGAHVSASPNHQTLRSTPLATRFAVAAYGILGYEYDLNQLSKPQLAEIAEQIRLYKALRQLLQTGEFYRLTESFCSGPVRLHSWCCTSRNRTKAICLLLQELAEPVSPYPVLRAAGLKPDARYLVREAVHARTVADAFSDIPADASSALSAESPAEPNALCSVISGTVLMYCGLPLKQPLTDSPVGRTHQIASDYAAGLYLIEEEGLLSECAIDTRGFSK